MKVAIQKIVCQNVDNININTQSMKAIMFTRNIHCQFCQIHCPKIKEMFDIENHSYD